MSKQLNPVETNRATAEAVYDVLFGTHDLDRLDEYLAADVVQHVSHESDIHGIEGVREYFEEMYSVMPDISYELLETVADGNRVACRVQLSGTMDGELSVGDERIEATGETVTWEAFSSFRFEDEKVVESNVVVDELTFLEGIGASSGLIDRAA